MTDNKLFKILVWLKKVRFINVAYINRLFYYPSAYIIVLALPGNSAVTKIYRDEYAKSVGLFSNECLLFIPVYPEK